MHEFNNWHSMSLDVEPKSSRIFTSIYYKKGKKKEYINYTSHITRVLPI